MKLFIADTIDWSIVFPTSSWDAIEARTQKITFKYYIMNLNEAIY
jgi:hypothetical protein